MDTIDGRIVFTTSFGIEDQLIAHHIFSERLPIEVVTLDTGRLFPETYALWQQTEERYGVRIRAFYPDSDLLAALVADQGINGFYHSKDMRLACCSVRKVEPLGRALAGASAWITGLRSDQSEQRSDMEFAQWDCDRLLIKISPLTDYDRARVVAECVEARSAGERAPFEMLSLDRLRAVHARDQVRRVRARRPLVVGTRPVEGVRSSCRFLRPPGQDRSGMTGSSRIAPLANLPLFHDFEGRKIVVVGSSEAARWKAELLTAAGANVLHVARAWTTGQLAGAALVIGDLADDEEARRFVDAGHRAAALVNIIDRPEFSDVRFGTIVNRSPVVIGISTDGAAPMLGQSIRARIESVLPVGCRPGPRSPNDGVRGSSFRSPTLVSAEHSGSASPPRPGPTPTGCLRTPISRRLASGERADKGRIILVGAGPGDPELLTLKAVRALQAATVILHDQLVGPKILELARREARRVAVGKTGHGPSCKQVEINRMMVELALAGETVVRLKGGDPMIFGRAAEEIDACRAASVEVTVVPGISAAQGAAASLLLSLTERRHARRVQFVTGHGADGKLPADIDWASVADRAATTVLYMPRRTLDEFVRKALAKGLDPATPAIAVASATLPDETHAVGKVAEIGALAIFPAGAPVTVIIGWVGRRLAPASSVLPFRRAVAS